MEVTGPKQKTFESLQEYTDMNMEGLRDDIVKLIAGEDVVVNVAKFQNDMVTFKTKNDVLTLGEFYKLNFKNLVTKRS